MVNKWISIKDELPENGQSIFMLHKLKAVIVGYYKTDGFYRYDITIDMPIKLQDIEYWFPEPERERSCK